MAAGGQRIIAGDALNLVVLLSLSIPHHGHTLVLITHNQRRTTIHPVVVVVVFTLKAVPVSTQYFLTSVLVQLTRTPSVVTG